MLKTSKAPSFGELHTFAFLAFSLAFAGLPLYIHAPDYYVTQRGVDLAAIGAVLLFLRLFDAVQDPFIGQLLSSQKHRTPVIVAGAVLFICGFWMVFHPPTVAPLIWFAVSIACCTTGFSVLSIAMYAFVTERRLDEHQRLTFLAWREGYGLLGILCAAALPSILIASYGHAPAFRYFTWCFLPAAVIGWILFMRWLQDGARRGLFHPPKEKPGTFTEFLSLLREPITRRFFTVFAVSTFASALPAVLIIFFVRDWLGLGQWLGLFLSSYFLSAALSIFFWVWLAKRVGKLRCWGWGMLMASLAFIWASILPPEAFAEYLLICVISGLALGADLALPSAMISDIVTTQGDAQHSARYFGFQAFLSKAMLALASGTALPFLAWFGYVPQNSGAEVLPAVYALVPSFLKAVAAAIVLIPISQQKEINYDESIVRL